MKTLSKPEPGQALHHLSSTTHAVLTMLGPNVMGKGTRALPCCLCLTAPPAHIGPLCFAALEQCWHHGVLPVSGALVLV